jgi:hypothetical protein
MGESKPRVIAHGVSYDPQPITHNEKKFNESKESFA